MALPCPTVLGNADAFLFGADVAEGTTAEQAEVRAWTLEQIGAAGIERLRSFQPTVELELEGHTVLCCHGSPRSYDDILLPESEGALDPWLADADLIAGGHTHRQWTRRIGEALFVNPGSVGLAYDHHRPRTRSNCSGGGICARLRRREWTRGRIWPGRLRLRGAARDRARERPPVP